MDVLKTPRGAFLIPAPASGGVLLFLSFFILSCSPEKTEEEILSQKTANPEPAIPLECYTDTGIVLEGYAKANPCYVCHTNPVTDFENEVEDFRLQFVYDFPEEIKNIGNPWLNAVKPWVTIENIPFPSEEEILKWIGEDNWGEAYEKRGKGDLVYFPDIPPIYSFDGSSYRVINIDPEGFVLDPFTGEYTGWRVFIWKPFPGYFPTNGRIDSTFIRLPEEFRKENGVFNLEVYKKNLAIVECAVKGIRVGQVCRGTELPPFVLPAYYEGDASHIPVITFQYPPGTEFAHPIYYLDPRNSYSFKSLRIKEMRYMKKLAYAGVREGEEEEEEGSIFWDRGRFVNLSGYWEMRAFIEDEKGRLRPQSEEESRFCTACHGGIGGTVDGTFTFWRKIPGSAGWREQDYNLALKSIKDWGYKYLSCASVDKLIAGDTVKEALKEYCFKRELPPGEYEIYFAMTGGGDHFRSNEEIIGIISTSEEVGLFLLRNPSLFNFTDSQGFIKPELFLPSRTRALNLNGQYMRVVKSQNFVYGRDLFGRPFGLSSGGNSLEELTGLFSTGVEESGLWLILPPLLSLEE